MNRLRILLAVFGFLLMAPVVHASGIGSSLGATPMSDAQMGGAGVTIVDYAFSPGVVSVPVGSTVSWVNAGAAPHTVTSDSGIFDSGTLGSGGSYGVTFSAPGYYTYHCAIHPNMTGAVQVN